MLGIDPSGGDRNGRTGYALVDSLTEFLKALNLVLARLKGPIVTSSSRVSPLHAKRTSSFCSVRVISVSPFFLTADLRRLDSAKQVENLQIQLHALAEQRDNALFQLSSAQETISSYASSLSNLQMVLEQFQAG